MRSVDSCQSFVEYIPIQSCILLAWILGIIDCGKQGQAPPPPQLISAKDGVMANKGGTGKEIGKINTMTLPCYAVIVVPRCRMSRSLIFALTNLTFTAKTNASKSF